MKNFYCLLIGTILLSAGFAEAKVTFKRSLVVDSYERSKEDNDKIDSVKNADLPRIYEMRVDTNVTNRYATTLITSKVRNLDSSAHETTFSIITPDKAFISWFVMEIDGKEYKAYVQEKEEAKRTYHQAKSNGFTAGHVAVSARDSNRFRVSVNLEPQSKAVFYLTYEELLMREDEKYEVVLNIHPAQPIKDFGVQVNILESRPIKFVRVPSLRSGNEISKKEKEVDPEAEIQMINETSAVVTFNPDVAKQQILASSLGGGKKEGLSGQFVVEYDVERDPQGGEVLVDGGYFVHFFASEELPPLKKQVVFVLDTSGSMDGQRISQLKQAMDSVLSELKSEDIFSIVEFNSNVKVWNISSKNVGYTYDAENLSSDQIPSAFPVTVTNIAEAKQIIQNFNADGGTDIKSALEIGLQVINTNKDPQSHQPMIIFLTDGESTVGITDTKEIIEKITTLNQRKVPIYALSLGDGADRAFLEQISLKNQGFARHIYEAADAHLQLEHFYKQISSPLLSNVTFKYTGQVSSVTQNHFPLLFHGGELHISGKFEDSELSPPQVEAWGVRGPIELKSKVYQASGSLERLWAYLTVRQLLDKREIANDKSGPSQEALQIALKYSFVTDVSSLVVVKPNATLAVDTEDASKPDFQDTSIDSLSFYSIPSLEFSYDLPPLGIAALQPDSISFLTTTEVPSFTTDLTTEGPSFIPALTTEASSFTTALTTKVPSFTTEIPLSNMPWITTSLNPNGTITLDSKVYLMGIGKVLSVRPECSNSLNSSKGTCTLLEKCQGFLLRLSDMASFKKHFCELEQVYAGICCPISPKH